VTQTDETAFRFVVRKLEREQIGSITVRMPAMTVVSANPGA
jgi:hypothetical protein